MKKLARMITMGGFGLLAAVTFGAGPAQAVTVEHTAQSKPSSPLVKPREGVQIAGFYRTPQNCGLAGRFGQRGGFWDGYNCSPVRLGPGSGAWALQVASYDNWDRLGFGVPLRSVSRFPNQFRPVWMGQYGPGRPARVIHRHPGRAIQSHPGRVFYGNSGPAGGGHRAQDGFGPRGSADAGPRQHGAPTGPQGTRSGR